jgi:hypothetical protein
MDAVMAKLLVLIILALIVLMFAAMWRIFKKAGHPGWACLIPIYNTLVLLDIAEMSGLWLLALFVPYLNILVAIVMTVRIALAFRKNALFGFGLVLLPFLFYPLLAFTGDERHYGLRG